VGVVGGRMMEGLRRTLLTGAAACALLVAPNALAQQTEDTAPLGNLPIGQDVPADATLLLTANELTYNIDTQRVIAVGRGADRLRRLQSGCGPDRI
jgi:lipopolysaccharide assembly outer membrane protein LptD (OstA)